MSKKILRWLNTLISAVKKHKKERFLKKNKRLKRKECYICKEEFFSFYKWKTDVAKPLSPMWQTVGSDTSNFGCYYCGCNDRERHLFMYFDKLNLWEKIEKGRVLHIAPEKYVAKKIEDLSPTEYIKGDISPKLEMIRVDITEIQFPDRYFDFIICNHVIEHVPDYLKAFSELERVLNDSGIVILQTPYSELLYNHFEDKNIDTDELRIDFYGQYDHVRIVSRRQFLDELNEFFDFNIIKNSELFSDEDCFRYGVNKKEDLIMLRKKKVI